MKIKFKSVQLTPLFLFVMILFSACSKEKCNVTLLSFNNHLSKKIKVDVRELTKVIIVKPGSSETVKIKPYKTYNYTVKDYLTSEILGQDNVTVDACVSMGIDIN